MTCVAGCQWLNAQPIASKLLLRQSMSSISMIVNRCYLLVKHWWPVDSIGRQVDRWQWRRRWHAGDAYVAVQLNWTLLRHTRHRSRSRRRCSHCIITDGWRPALTTRLCTSPPLSQTLSEFERTAKLDATASVESSTKISYVHQIR